MERIVVRKGRERSVENRHPWIFSGAVAEAPREGTPAGETVAVVAADGTPLGYGSWSPSSQIRVRMLAFGDVAAPDAATITERVASSVGRRADFFANAYTNAVRLVNAESDGLPGVVADYYAGFVVCQFSSAGAEFWKSAIVEALMNFAPFCRGVSERTDLKDREKEGLEKVGGESRWRETCGKSEKVGGESRWRETCGKSEKVGGESRWSEAGGESRWRENFRVLAGEEPPEFIEIAEGSVKFLVDVRKGHKTGFYLDQREARLLVGSLANGAEVLNCFCYTGGFGLFARACGAAKVTQVDVSADALALAKRNEQLVHMCGTAMEYVEADVFTYLRTCRDEGKTFDMIVLDPPKFAATKSQVMKAARGYKDINLLAMKLLRPNGYLATFSCSGAMDEALFGKILVEAAHDAKRLFQVVAKTRQGADHPVALNFPEGHYLKGTVLRAID